jgi:hypothetical protein
MLMEKNVLICDDCEVTIATQKCGICGKDLCDDCSNSQVENRIVGSIMELITCDGCDEQLGEIHGSKKDMLHQVFNEKTELKNQIIETLKNVMMLHKIEEENKPKLEPNPNPKRFFNPININPLIYKKSPPVDQEFMQPYPYRIKSNGKLGTKKQRRIK